MDFIKYITTPKITTESNPKTTAIKMTAGRLVGGFLFFPSGPAGKLHFFARVGAHQIIPFNTGESYNLNDCIVPLHLAIDLPEAPYVVECVTWNDSTIYDHALTVGFFVIPGGKKKYNLETLINDFAATKGYHKP